MCIRDREEVRQLASSLGVDFIIALENLQLKATKSVRFLNEFNCFQGAVDVKVLSLIHIFPCSDTLPSAMKTRHKGLTLCSITDYSVSTLLTLSLIHIFLSL